MEKMTSDIKIRTLFIDKKNIIFAAKKYNIVGKYNLDSQCLELLTQIPEHSFFEEKLVGKILVWEKWLIFLPYSDNKIRMWNEETKEWLSFNVEIKNKMAFYYDGYVLNGKLYAFSPCENRVVILDLSKRISLEFVDVFNEKRDYYFGVQGCCDGKNIYFPDYEQNRILILNSEKNIYKWIEIKEYKNNGFVALDLIEDNILVAPKFGKDILICNKNNGEYNIVKSSEEYSEKFYIGIRGINMTEILGISGYFNELVCINNNIRKVEKLESSIESITKYREDTFIILDSKGNVYLFNNENHCERIKVKTSFSDIVDWNNAEIKIDKIVNEKADFKIEDYIKIICKNN